MVGLGRERGGEGQLGEDVGRGASGERFQVPSNSRHVLSALAEALGRPPHSALQVQAARMEMSSRHATPVAH